MVLKRKYQQGGAMPTNQAASEAAPVNNSGNGDPMQTIVELFAQGLQTQDCNALAQGAEMFLQLVQEAQGGAEAAPAGQPVFAKGGKLVSRKQATLQLICK